MFQHVARFFKTPVFADEDQSFVARMLYIILRGLIALCAIFTIPFIFVAPDAMWRYVIIGGTVTVSSLGLMALTRRGLTRVASFWLVVMLFITVTFGAATAGGLRAPIFTGYIVVIVIAGLMLGERPGIIVALLSLAMAAAMTYAEARGTLPEGITYSAYARYFIAAFFMLTVMILQYLASNTTRKALRAAQAQLAEQRRAEAKLQQRADEMSSLYTLGTSLIGGQDLYNALRPLVRELRRWMTVDTFYVSLYDEQTDTASFPLYLTYDDDLQMPPRNLKEKPGLTREIIDTEKTLYLPDAARPEAQAQHNIVVNVNMGVRSFIGIPLIMKGRVIGIMSIQAREPNAYSEENLRLLETIAVQVASTVERLNLLEALQKELAERKQVEVALRESEARLRAVIDQIPYNLWVCDADGRYIIQNKAGEKLTPNIVGKTPLEYEGVPVEIRQRWEREHRLALSGSIHRSGLVEHVVKGERRSFITTVAPIVVDERVIGLTGLSVDVTELRRAEEEVRTLNDELEARVAERTRQMEDANRELESFSYSVSHDLRAPLRGISGYARILAEDHRGQLDVAGQEILDKVIASAKEMNSLIEGLLALSQLNRKELHKTEVDLTALANDVLDALRRAEADRAVACRVDEGLTCLADATLIRSVLENLLGNAWKYSSKNPEARIEFGALASHQLPPNSANLGGEQEGGLVFFVRDNGAGFDMQYAEKLFGAFQRLHTEFAGHGIGLATVQRIIHRHGGRIWAEGETDKGATFYFTLGT